MGREPNGADGGETLPGSLLPWLARVTEDPGLESRVVLRDVGDGRGRGLRALRTLAPGEVIFSLPFRLVFAEDVPEEDGVCADDASPSSSSSPSDEDEDMPWSALMAMRLLEERARGGELAEWIASLPAFVSTPPLEYSPEEIALAEDPAIEGEAKSVAEAHARAAETLRSRLDAIGCTADDLRWATGVLHSRCFTHGPHGTHLAVPGVDMCNHCFEAPSAGVRVVTSPDNCQGARATEEIAARDDAAGEGPDGDDAFFQLCAGEDGIEEGEEVTISYGPWPNDPFFLYFGFVPSLNPNDAVVLFADVTEVAACAERLGLLTAEQAEEAKGKAAVANTEVNHQRQRQRMVITREGVDYSVVAAAEAVGLPGWEDLVEGRCREILRSYSTTLKVDREMLSGEREDGVMTENEATAVLFRMSKKEVLLGPLAAAAAKKAAAVAAATAAPAEA